MLSILYKRKMANSEVGEQLEKIIEKFDEYNIKLGQLQFLEKYDKIAFDKDGNLYINKYTTYQPLLRWIFNQNRENCMNNIRNEFINYSGLLDGILIYMCFPDFHRDEFVDIRYRVVNFNKKLLHGLDILLKTYYNNQKYRDIIKDIQYNLIRRSNTIMR